VRLSAHADSAGGNLSLDGTDVAARALAPLANRFGIGVDDARMDVHAMVSLTRERSLPFEVDFRARGLDVHNPSVDGQPWRGLAFEGHVTGALDAAAGRLRVSAAEMAGMGVRLVATGWADLGEAARGSWTFRTPPGAPLPCASLLEAQPGPVRAALKGLRLAGNLGVAVSVTYDAAAWETLVLDLDIDPTCGVQSDPADLAALTPTLQKGLPPPPGTRSLPLGPYHGDFALLAEMPAHLPAAFLTAEDGRFFQHPGFDLEMIRRALAHDLETRSFGKGASTMTQQLAKNLFLSHHRTLARKLEEVVYAWRLHETLPKRRILELYLNIIELGPHIRGVKQAARAYFGKELRDLLPIESAHLAALTPNPQGLARRFRDGHVDEGWLQRLYDLLAMMKRSGRLSAAEVAAARAGKLTLSKI